MTLHFKRLFEPALLFRKSIVLIDGCNYFALQENAYVGFPPGTFLLQVKVQPNLYSNILLIGTADEGKTVKVSGIFNRSIYHSLIYITFLLSLITLAITREELLLIPLLLTTIPLLYWHFYYKRHTEKVIKITMW